MKHDNVSTKKANYQFIVIEHDYILTKLRHNEFIAIEQGGEAKADVMMIIAMVFIIKARGLSVRYLMKARGGRTSD
jgi:hypothetical protein